MFDATAVRDSLTEPVEHLVFEVNTLWKTFQETDWFGDNGHFPNAHYGYIMLIFARLDLFSRYWNGGEIWKDGKKNQTERMIQFMERYLHHNKMEEHRVAVKLWRHTLMHTAEPREVLNVSTKTGYRYLLHFGDWLPRTDHYTFDLLPSGKSLKIGITYLADDLKCALDRYLIDLDNDARLQDKYLNADAGIREQYL